MTLMNPRHPSYVTDVENFTHVWNYPFADREKTEQVISDLLSLSESYAFDIEDLENDWLDQQTFIEYDIKLWSDKIFDLGEKYTLQVLLGRKVDQKKYEKLLKDIEKKIKSLERLSDQTLSFYSDSVKTLEKRIEVIQKRIETLKSRKTEAPKEFEIIEVPIHRRYLKAHPPFPERNIVHATTKLMINSNVSFNQTFQNMLREELLRIWKLIRIPDFEIADRYESGPNKGKLVLKSRLFFRLDFPQDGKLNFQNLRDIKEKKIKEYSKEKFREYNETFKKRWMKLSVKERKELNEKWQVEGTKYVGGLEIPEGVKGHVPCPKTSQEYENDQFLTTISTQQVFFNYDPEARGDFDIAYDMLIKNFSDVCSYYGINQAHVNISEARVIQSVIDSNIKTRDTYYTPDDDLIISAKKIVQPEFKVTKKRVIAPQPKKKKFKR